MAHYFKSGPSQSKLNVDKSTRTIYGVIAIEKGRLNDYAYRPWTVNDAFLNDLLAVAKKQKEGVLSNWGHNYDNNGKRLGRAINWRKEGDQVKFDLVIFEAADKSPGLQDLGQYVMDLAIEDNKALMNSINFGITYFYQLDSSGKELKVWYYDKAQGSWISSNPDLGDVFPKMGELYSTDIVDAGAATKSLYSVDEEMIVLSHIIHREGFMSKFEEVYENFPLLANFYQQKNKKGILESIKSLFVEQDHSEQDAIISQLQKEIKQMSETTATTAAELSQAAKDKEALESENKDLKTTNAELKQSLESLTGTLSALTTRLEALEKAPGANHTFGEGGDEDDQDDQKDSLKAWKQSELYRKAKKINSQVKDNK